MIGSDVEPRNIFDCFDAANAPAYVYAIFRGSPLSCLRRLLAKFSDGSVVSRASPSSPSSSLFAK